MSRFAEPQVSGVVVYVGAYGESDRLVELLTAESGRCILLARGARASRRRFVGALEAFASLDVQLRAGRGRWPTLLAADLRQARLPIRASLPRILRASALCNCARHLAPEDQAAPTLLRLLTWGLDAVAAGAPSAASRALPRMAAAAGIMPPLETCCLCGQAAAELAMVTDTLGLACRRCQPRGVPLTAPVRAALAGAPVPSAAVAQALEDCILAWVGVHVGRPLRRLDAAAIGMAGVAGSIGAGPA